MKKEIPLFKVFMADTAADKVAKVLNSGFIGQGPMVDQEYVKAKKGLNDLGIKTSFSPIPFNNGKMGNMLSYGITYHF